MFKLQNYKLVISNYSKIQITSQLYFIASMQYGVFMEIRNHVLDRIFCFYDIINFTQKLMKHSNGHYLCEEFSNRMIFMAITRLDYTLC